MAEPDGSLTGLLYARAWMQHVPLSGTFELSPMCNLACKMCYVRKTPAEVKAHHRPIMTLDQWKRLGDQAEEAGTLFLLLTGGEPFLWPDFRELYEYLHRKGFLISINTNGSLIDEDTVECLLEHPPARINITLYGASEEAYHNLCGVSGVFERIAQNVDRLLEAGIHIKLNSSLTQYNATDLEKILRFAEKRNVLCDIGTYMFPPIRREKDCIGQNERFTPKEAAYYRLLHRKLTQTPEQYRGYLQRAAEGIIPPLGLDESCIDPRDGTVKCQAGHGTFWVTWDGYLLSCGMVPDPKVDLNKKNFPEAWEELGTKTEQIRLSGICQKCENKKVCHTCMAAALAETGSHSGVPIYLCCMAEELRKQAQEELEKLNE